MCSPWSLVLGVSLELGAWDLELFQMFLAACALFPGSMRDNLPPIRHHRRMITKNIGMLLLAIYLILVGIISLVPTLGIPAIVMGILALAAGIMILLGK
jgi:hypothetical protein